MTPYEWWEEQPLTNRRLFSAKVDLGEQYMKKLLQGISAMRLVDAATFCEFAPFSLEEMIDHARRQEQQNGK